MWRFLNPLMTDSGDDVIARSASDGFLNVFS
jgi:hypothetical protein